VSTACGSARQCALTVSGNGTAEATVGQLGQFALQGNLTVDVLNAAANGGQCYPVSGRRR
jgi:hypothetical protein